MKLSIIACDGFTDVASSLITLQKSMNGLVDQGILTKEQADAAVAKETQDAITIVQRVRLGTPFMIAYIILTNRRRRIWMKSQMMMPGIN